MSAKDEGRESIVEEVDDVEDTTENDENVVVAEVADEAVDTSGLLSRLEEWVTVGVVRIVTVDGGIDVEVGTSGIVGVGINPGYAGSLDVTGQCGISSGCGPY